MAATDSFTVRVYGRGGHGSEPDKCIDPVIIGCSTVMRLQTIVSREVRPGEFAVVTCGSIHAGDADNVIPDYLDLKLTVRTSFPEVRAKTVAAVKRVINAESEASGAAQKPTIKQVVDCPATINDEEAAAKI